MSQIAMVVKVPSYAGNSLIARHIFPKTVLQLSFRLQHGCRFNKLSIKYPEAVMAQWCDYAIDFIEYGGKNPNVIDLLEEDLFSLQKQGYKIIRNIETGPETRVVAMKCACSAGSSAADIIEASGCLILYPILYMKGWEHYRTVVLDDKNIPRMFRKLARQGEVEVTMKKQMSNVPLRESLMIPVDEVLSSLTQKQGQALLSAIDNGYYRIPRKTTLEDIARNSKISRTTFEEHARKAEIKLMNSMSPYISLYFTRSNGLSARPTAE
ncbi:MAG: hypothetical protein FJ358_04890 [Thaumarchaeota archaeon]|nr:hypothetical protein [Nitrososphaerota archaeon]